jgi:hypothetical protein
MSSTAERPAAVEGGQLAWVNAALRDAVARVAATEHNPTDPFRGLYVSDDAALEASAQLQAGGLDDRIHAVGAMLGLEPLDEAILALCAAPELDPRCGRLVGYLHDDLTRRQPSARLIGRLLAPTGATLDAVLQRLAVDAPLRWLGIVQMAACDPPVPVADRGMFLDDMVVAELLGAALAAPDPSLGIRLVQRTRPAPGRPDLAARLAGLLPPAPATAVACIGPDAEQVVAHAWGRDLVLLSAAVAGDPAAVARARLQARLTGGAVVVEGASELDAAAIAAFHAGLRCARDLNVLVDRADVRSALGSELALHQLDVPPLTAPERARAWTEHLPGAPVEAVADRFALSAAQIREAAAIAALRVRERGGARVPRADDLLAAGRELSHGLMGDLATRLVAGRTWDDLVLPEPDLAVLQSLAAFVRHRERVMNEWGFARHVGCAPGLTALFAGESGTGKTLAARVIAADLGLEAYRVDLAGVVSKYIGETEKNLDRIFSVAAGANAVLIFDEADALFGRRSAVSDARDRYANLEVAYLLQRLETYDGAVILTTNLRHNLDQAFLRRFDFTIDFPLPDAAQRAELWRRHLPAEAPTRGLQFEHLAAIHQITGGSIASCARLAAFAAAQDDGPITMQHLERAVALELRKLGRLGAPGR